MEAGRKARAAMAVRAARRKTAVEDMEKVAKEDELPLGSVVVVIGRSECLHNGYRVGCSYNCLC